MRCAFRLLIGVLLFYLVGCETTATPTQAERGLRSIIETATLQEVDANHALLSVFQVDQSTAYIAGGGIGPNAGVIYKWDGSNLTPEVIPTGPALWWIWGHADGTLWACGDRGRILRRDPGGDWRTEVTPLAEDTILYGIWGDDDGHLWAVGGSYRRTGEQNIVLTSSGDGSWNRLVLRDVPADFTFFKVWGTDPTWIVGDLGWILRLSGNEQRFFQTPAQHVLFTVHGHGDDVFAVGGQTKGQIYGLTDPNVIREQVGGVGILNGIYVREDGWRVTAGEGGQVLIGSNDAQWAQGMLFPDRLTQRTIHGVSSEERTLFVGGDLRRMSHGFLISSTGFEMLEANAR